MGIKAFKIPTFEDWCKSGKKFQTKIGEYTCRIDVFSWYADGSGATYQIGVSADGNPLNIYSNTIFKRTITVKTEEVEKLRDWYNNVTEEMNNNWVKYITDNYILEV